MPGTERTFFQESARGRVTTAIKEIEAQTSAEVVVAVRSASGSYRDVDYLFGFGVSVAVLGVLLFHPYPFATEGMPLDVVAAFTLGALFCGQARPLRRALVSRKRLDTNCRDAARAAFVELGVGRTRERNGIFVLVSLFERRVQVVADVGVEPALRGTTGPGADTSTATGTAAAHGAAPEEWRARVAALESALAGGPSIDRFIEALRALAPPLAASMPHQADDVNELPDEVA
jgi:putative membrane protein